MAQERFEEYLRDSAAAFAEEHNLDPERVFRVLQRTELPRDKPTILIAGRKFKTRRTFGPVHQPSLREAVEFLGPSEALSVLESENVRALAEKVELARQLCFECYPVYTFEELASTTESLIEYLEQHRRPSLGSPWPGPRCPDSFLVRAFRKANSPVHDDRNARAKQLIERVSEAMGPGYCDRVIELDAKLAKLRITVMKELWRCVASRSADDLWRSCLNRLTDTLSREEAAFCLETAELYFGQIPGGQVDLLTGLLSRMECGSPGGLAGILSVIADYEQELTIRLRSRICEKLAGLVPQDERNISRWLIPSYFQVVRSPQLRAKVDDALKLFAHLQGAIRDFDQRWRRRLRLALEDEFRVV